MKIGDEVAHKDKDIQGIVQEIHEDYVKILIPEGFIISLPINQLVIIGEDLEKQLANPQYIPKDQTPTSKNKTYNNSIPELDLHIEKIIKKTKIPSSVSPLEFQLQLAIEFLQKLKKSHHTEAIVIHGHGKNILKKALIKKLKEKGYDFYEASYSKYGGGALKVRIKR